MKRVLVMGINGTFGREAARAMITEGFEVRALLRDAKKLPAEFVGMQVVEGNVMDREALTRACSDIDIVVYAVNPANYDWEERAVPYLDRVIETVTPFKLTLIFPGNVYNFDPADSPDFAEDAAQHPVTGKGVMRKTMEEHLQQAAGRGLKVIILRMGDFIASDSKSIWLSHLLKAGRGGEYRLAAPGPAGVRRSWAYVPDAATVAARLATKAESLPAFSRFHFSGYYLSLEEMAEVVSQATGRSVHITAFPWWPVRLMARFSVAFSGLLEMRYLWEKEVHLLDSKLELLLGDNGVQTELATALRESRLIR